MPTYARSSGMPEIATAWDLIGEEGKFRIAGGRAIYTDVAYNDATRGQQVRLARLDPIETADGMRLRQINRWVDPDTRIEVLERW